MDLVAALLIFLFPLAYSPGPGNMFFAANGARFGFRSTLPANLGYHIETWLVTAAIGSGFIAVMAAYPQLFVGLKIAGSVYVLWLGWKLLRSGVLDHDQTARPASFLDGAVLLVLNPKAYVIIALMFTQFVPLTDGDRLLLVLLITTVFTLNNLVAFTLWTIAGDRLAAGFRSPSAARRLNLFFGAILMAVGVWMLVA